MVYQGSYGGVTSISASCRRYMRKIYAGAVLYVEDSARGGVKDFIGLCFLEFICLCLCAVIEVCRRIILAV